MMSEMNLMDSENNDYVKAIFGEIKGHHEIMEKYVPGFADSNVRMRRAFYPHPTKDKEAAIPRKYRELIMIALEIGTGRGGDQGRGGMPGVNHTRTAVRQADATPKEVAEMVAIAVYLCGQPSIVDYGYHCIKAAEEEYQKLQKNQ